MNGRALLVSCAGVIVLAACGGPSDGELVADCTESGTAELAARYRELLGPAVSSPEKLAAETLEAMCEELVERDVHELDPDSPDFEETLRSTFEENPEIFRSACDRSAAGGIEALPPELRTPEFIAATKKSARDYCDIVIREGYVDFSRRKTVDEIRQDIDRIYREHPEISTPLCVLGGMMEYESQPLIVGRDEVSPERAERYLERVCEEAVRAGAIDPLALELTPSQQRELEQIGTRILDEMIAAGELP